MDAVKNHPLANTNQGLFLIAQWSALNERCKYQGAKVGLGQPSWWYKCWEDEINELGY